MGLRESLQHGIRPSRARGLAALRARSLLNALLFFAIFMLALPWLAQRLLPAPLPLPEWLRGGLAAVLFLFGIGVWLACLDAFSRLGRGTPLPMEAPRELVTGGPFGVIRNPIMAAELLVIWSVALHLARLGVVIYALLITIAADWVVRHVEEPELRRRFGPAYEAYCRRVPPRPLRSRSCMGGDASRWISGSSRRSSPRSSWQSSVTRPSSPRCCTRRTPTTRSGPSSQPPQPR